MIYLNLLYFFIISWYGYKFLTSPNGRIMDSLLVPEQQLRYSGPELFWCLTFSTGLLAFSLNVGLDLMALRLLVLEIFCIIGLRIVPDRPIWTPALRLYIAYLVWLLIGCFYGPSWLYGVRVILKFSYPLLICLFASAAVRDPEVFLKSSLLARGVALICLISSFLPFTWYIIPGVFWYATARAINFISIMVLSMGLFYFTSAKRKNLIYSLIFILPCFLWVFRTSIMGSLVAVMAFYFIRYRLRSLPIIAAVLIAGVVAVFTIPSLRNKMFKAEDRDKVSIEQFQEGQVTMDNVNTNAREAMWEHLENRFFEGHELTGSGTGSVQQYMYTHRIFGGLKVPHSDYVQMKCDNGLIALLMYCTIAILIYLHCFTTYWSTDNKILRLSAIVAGASMAGVFVTLYSDNTVNYSMATLSMPFGFYGMMLGLNKRFKEQ